MWQEPVANSVYFAGEAFNTGSIMTMHSMSSRLYQRTTHKRHTLILSIQAPWNRVPRWQSTSSSAEHPMPSCEQDGMNADKGLRPLELHYY